MLSVPFSFVIPIYIQNTLDTFNTIVYNTPPLFNYLILKLIELYLTNMILTTHRNPTPINSYQPAQPTPHILFGQINPNAKLGIFTTHHQGKHAPWVETLIDEAKHRNLNVTVFHPDDVTLEINGTQNAFWLNNHQHTSSPFDVVLPLLPARWIKPDDLTILRHLELMGSKVVNPPSALEVAENKVRTHQELAAQNLQQPETVFALSEKLPKQLVNQLTNWKTAFVKKITQASGAQEVQKVDTPTASQILKTASSGTNLIQHGVLDKNSTDYCYFVVDGKVVLAVKRFRAFLQRPEAERENFRVEPDNKFSQLALQAMKSLNLKIGSVDIVDSPKGPLVIEVNPASSYPKEYSDARKAVMDYTESLLPQKLSLQA